MDSVRVGVSYTLWATVDTLLATFGLAVLAYPAAIALFAVVDVPVLTPVSLTQILAVGGAYPFVAGDWSLGALGDYIFVWTASLLGLAVAAFPLAWLVGGVPDGLAGVVQVAIFACAHLVAAVAVIGYEIAPTRYL